MSLRGRLTSAFLVVVLGPVLVGAVFVALIVSYMSDVRTDEQLDAAADTVEGRISMYCERIHTANTALAMTYRDGHTDTVTSMAELIVERGVSDGVTVSVDGEPSSVIGAALPQGQGVDCVAPDASSEQRVSAILVSQTISTPDGNVTLASYRIVNADFLNGLADHSHAAVELDDAREPRLEAGLSNPDKWRTADSFIPLRVGIPHVNVGPMYWVLGGMLVASIGLAIGLAAWLARSTTRPLGELSTAAERLAEGNLSIRVPVHGRDEMGQLAGSFNQMAAQTQRYVQALTSSRDQMRGQLRRLGQTLSATLDLDRIMEVILDTAIVATGAGGGVVMLVDVDDSNRLKQRAGEGDLGLDEPATVRFGEGVIGRIAAEGVPMSGRMVNGRFHGLQRSQTEPNAESLIAVPFRGRSQGVPLADDSGWDGLEGEQGAVMGVLVLYNRVGAPTFDDRDFETLETFAGQVAVAVENVLLHRQAQRLSLTDPLTGLWNLRFMQSAVQREMERARRYGHCSALLAIDIDLFKAVNDTYGHPAGDQVLIELARRINGQIREVDLAFRQGGEEFMVLLPETDEFGAVSVAERLTAAVNSRPFRLNIHDGPMELDISISIGVAVTELNGETAPELISAADQALYSAKESGRNTWRIARW
ncbi:sensor domain-containing diguanylate cyclase [Haloglycomyces albus]|uniref:sensor domain-containing diguanylate cyclase n=1 Tax=Haloglycomyces albus TaxID=526067 RepID=UPI0004B69150|nr:diguanylate cyclase [Haloglycomyces albus]